MAAPTNVRVESNSIATTTLRWSYSGSNQIAVYRSTDGVSYSEITAAGTRVATGTTSYTDTGLSAGTKYYYKLTDDLGSTFSSVVSTWTQQCAENFSQNQVLLPRANGDPESEFNELAERVEQALGDRVLDPEECAICPSDGQIVLNCSSGCKDFVIVADEDINSISINWCDDGDHNIDLVIPPNTTNRRICGWPAGFGFNGDECFQLPLSSGANGKTMSVGSGPGSKAKPSQTGSKPHYSRGSGRSPGSAGPSSCTCVPPGNGGLTIKSCTANNSLSCSGAKSLRLMACGGRAPYTWSNTGSVVLSATSGSIITVTPPTNSGSAVLGTAYWVTCFVCASGFCTAGACSLSGFFTLTVGCDDAFNASNCTGASSCTDPGLSAVSHCCNNNTAVCADPGASCTDYRSTCQGVTVICDQRTAGMISNGCNPCGLQQGSTVTVTDAVGKQTTIILRA